METNLNTRMKRTGKCDTHKTLIEYFVSRGVFKYMSQQTAFVIDCSKPIQTDDVQIYIENIYVMNGICNNATSIKMH